MVADFAFGERSGVDVWAHKDGIFIAGWYDTFVGIEGGFVTWGELDELRRKAKRRKAFQVTNARP